MGDGDTRLEPRGDPGARGMGDGDTRLEPFLARASVAGREPRGDPGARGMGDGDTRLEPFWLGLP